MDRIQIVIGDITEQDVDAIVNAANNDLILGAGVAGAIRKKGGPSIQEECNKTGSINVGEAALTGGGKLKAKWVIHAASMGFGIPTSARSLKQVTLASLETAKSKSMNSIAFPAIGTGVSGFPMKECSEIMMREALKFINDNDYPRVVKFCLYSESDYNVFVRTFQELVPDA